MSKDDPKDVARIRQLIASAIDNNLVGQDCIDHLGDGRWFVRSRYTSPFAVALMIERTLGVRLDLVPSSANAGAWRGMFYSYLRFESGDSLLTPCKLPEPLPIPALEGAKDWVYFMRQGDAVKIGRSNDPRGRLDALQTSTPLLMTILAVIPDGKREAEFHRRFADLRIRREWFRYEGSLKEFLDSLNPQGEIA